MDAVKRDLRFAFRSLTSRPGLAAVAVLTLILGVGANIAIFSVVYGVLFRPLGFADGPNLVGVIATSETEGQERSGSSLADFRFLEQQQSSFDRLGFFGWSSMTLESPDGARQLAGVFTDPELFTTLGVRPIHGRFYGPADASAGLGTAAVVSEAAWRRLWGADPDAIGSRLRIDGRSVELVGVVPDGSELPSPFAEIWVPVGPSVAASARFGRDERDFVIVGRLGESVTLEEARREVASFAQQLADDFPGSNQGWGWNVTPLRDHLLGDSRGPIWIAFVAVGLVLLLTCANITHLLLVRTAGRQREMAVRAALGAGRSDLVRLVVAESLILAAAGGVGGALAAVWLKDLLLALDPGILPSFGVFAIDGPVLVFAVLLTGVAGLACSVLPALYGTVAASPARGASLSAKSQAAGAGAWWRRGLLGFEVALSLVLLAGAALLGRALYDLHRVDPGFDPADTYMAYFLLDDADYDEPATRVRFFEELQTAVAAIPGVESAALSTSPPVPDTGIVIDVPYRAEGQAPAADDAVRRAAFRIVTPNYFATLGLPLKAGRDVERFDDADAPDVVVINESLATRLWGGAGEAVGRRLEMDFDGDFRPLEVVGVVGDTRFAGLHRTPRPALFIPHAQLPFRGMGLTARTGLDGDVFARELRRVAAELDARVPPADVFSLEQRLRVSYGLERFFAVLLSAFAGVALVLTAGGIYGVFSFWVSERTREIGVRMALGAARREVVALVVRQGIGVALGGVAVGAVAAVWASRVIQSRFAGVSAADPAMSAILAASLLAMAVLACLAPAVRASRIEPTAALRSE